MSEIRARSFAEDLEDEALEQEFNQLMAGDVEQPPAPVKTEPEDPRTNPSFMREFFTQVGGGVEDGFKSSMNAMWDIGAEVNSWMPEALQNENYDQIAQDMKFDLDLAKSQLPVTSRQGWEANVLNFTRAASQFLIPFGAISKGVKAATGVKGAANFVGSSAATGFLAFDPAEKNLANVVESVPALQNPVTEYLSSDGSESMKNRFKNAILETAFIGVGAGVFKGAEVGVKAVAKTEPVQVAKQVLGDNAEKLTDSFVKGVEAVRQKRNLKKQGLDSDKFSELAGLKKDVDKEITVSQDIAQKLSSAENQARIDGVLTGDVDVSALKTSAPKKGFTEKALKAKADLVKKVYGKDVAEFDGDKILKSAGLVDDPVISDLMKFASEQSPKAKLSWDDTNARAFGMSVEEAQVRFGTAGDFTAAIGAVKNEAISRAAKLSDSITKKGLDDPDSVEALAKFLEISDVEKMMSGEAGRALASLKQTKNVNEVLSSLDVISKNKMEAALKGFADDPDKLFRFGRQLGRSKVSDVKSAIHSYWINSVLSGPVTHLTNIVSNLAFLAVRPVERAGAAGVGVLTGSDKVLAREALEMYYGFYEGFRDGVRALKGTDVVDKELNRIIKRGTKFDEAGDVSAERGNMLLRKAVTGREEALSREEFFKMGPMGMGKELLGRALTAPTDFLGATDQFIKSMAARGEKRALAFRSAVDDGLTGADFDQRVKLVLNNSPVDATDRKMLENINEAAGFFAKETVFQQDLGKMGKAIVGLRDHVPGMEFVIPFVKTPLNILDETFLKRTPVGLASSRVRNEILSGGVKGQEAIAKMAIGSSVSASIVAAYTQGGITGAGPKNKAARERWLETHQPWSIKIGDKWYAYNRIEPIGSLIGLGARLGEVIEHNADTKILSPEEEEELAFGVAAAFTTYVTDKSFLAGVDNVISALEGDEYAVEQFVGNVASGFVPLSGMTRTIARAGDNELRDMDGVLDRIQGSLPGLSDSLPNRRNRFGDKVIAADRTTGFILPVSHTPGGVNDKKTQQINEIEMEAGVIISRPSNKFRGVKLSPAEYDARMEHFNNFSFKGKNVKDALIEAAENESYKALPSTPRGGKGEILKSIYRKYLKASDESFLQKNPELSVKVEKALLDSYTIDRELNPRTGEPKEKETYIGVE